MIHILELSESVAISFVISTAVVLSVWTLAARIRA